MLDAIEEALNLIAVAVKPGAEADWLLAVAFWRNVRPSAPQSDELPNGIAVIGPISRRDRSGTSVFC